MKKIFTRPPLRLFFFCLFFCAGPVLALDLFGSGEGDEAVIWESGINRYIGKHDFFRSKAFEPAYDPSGRAAVPYDLTTGRRDRASGAFSGVFMSAEGIENKRLDTLRHDWFVIDVKQAASGYLARRNEAQQDPIARQQDEQLQLEAARMARQRREMRAEMARMRKEMRNLNKPAADARSIEARMRTLDELRKKGLISQAEYDMKRREILNDI